MRSILAAATFAALVALVAEPQHEYTCETDAECYAECLAVSDTPADCE